MTQIPLLKNMASPNEFIQPLGPVWDHIPRREIYDNYGVLPVFPQMPAPEKSPVEKSPMKMTPQHIHILAGAMPAKGFYLDKEKGPQVKKELLDLVDQGLMARCLNKDGKIPKFVLTEMGKDFLEALCEMRDREPDREPEVEKDFEFKVDGQVIGGGDSPQIQYRPLNIGDLAPNQELMTVLKEIRDAIISIPRPAPDYAVAHAINDLSSTIRQQPQLNYQCIPPNYGMGGYTGIAGN